MELQLLFFTFTLSLCINNDPTEIIIGHIVWFLLIFSFPRCSITIFRGHKIVIVLFLFVVFHHNPYFSMLGPNIIVWHETLIKKVDVKGFSFRVRLHIPTHSAWTTHKTNLLVCLSHFEKIMHSINVLGGASVTVHPLTVHLRALYIYIYNEVCQKPLQKNIMNR